MFQDGGDDDSPGFEPVTTEATAAHYRAEGGGYARAESAREPRGIPQHTPDASEGDGNCRRG